MKFEKGKSGNPSGRKKLTQEEQDFKEACKSYSQEALNKLVYWMRSDEPKASIAACNSILDRGHGKPAQELSVKGSIKTITVNVIKKQK